MERRGRERRGRAPHSAPLPGRPAPAAARARGAATSARACLRLLLIRALVLDPVTALVGARVLAPRVGLHQTLGAPHGLELAVLEDLADQHRLVGVVIGLVHLDLAARGREVLAVDRLPD